jgi:hypothetical protein
MAFCWREPDANIYTAGIRMQPIFIGPLFAAQLANAGSTGESGRSRRNSYSEVTKQLPGNGEREYRIKSANEPHERVA